MVPLYIMHEVSSGYDAMADWTFTLIIACDAAVVADLPPPYVANDISVYKNRTYLGHETLRQAHLPIGENVLGLANSDAIQGAVYIGSQASVLGRVVAIYGRENLPTRLERIPKCLVPSVFLGELKTISRGGQKKQIRGCSHCFLGSAGGG